MLARDDTGGVFWIGSELTSSWGLEVTLLGATKGASPASSVFVGDSFRSEPSSAAVTGTASFTSSSGGESSSSQVFPVSSSRTPASKVYAFLSFADRGFGFFGGSCSFGSYL
jgi:hypothetical protein